MLLGQSAMCNKVWAVWGRQSVHWKSLRKRARFQTPPKVRIWSLLKTATHFFALLAAAPLFRTHRSRHGLHGVVAAFWLSVFASVFVPVAFSYSLSSQLSFWHRNNETASVAAVLETINLRKCTQLFVNRTFNYIPKWDGCLCTSHTCNWILKAWRKLGPHPTNWEHAL